MSPHKQDPASWEIEIDLSQILIRPVEVERKKVESGDALPDWTDSSLDVGNTGISSSGWANIGFVLGSCLIGVICALSIFDTSNIRGEGHIDRMTLSVRGRNLIRSDHNVSVWNLVPGPTQVAYSKQSPMISQSSRRALRLCAHKPIITSRTNVSSSWQNFQRSFGRGLRKLEAAGRLNAEARSNQLYGHGKRVARANQTTKKIHARRSYV